MRYGLALLFLLASTNSSVADEFDGVDESIVVYGDFALGQARADIIRKIESLGYTAKTRGEMVIFRPPKRWMGKVMLDRDGMLTFTRPFIAFSGSRLHGTSFDPGASVGIDDAINGSGALGSTIPIEDRAFSADAAVVDVVPEFGFWLLPSWTLLNPVHQRVRDAVQPELMQYRSVLWKRALEETVWLLVARLDALWDEGTALDRGPLLKSPQERKMAALDYWSTRASTDEGHEVCRVVEVFLREVVQYSDTPVSEAEWREVMSQREDGLTLDLGGDLVKSGVLEP